VVPPEGDQVADVAEVQAEPAEARAEVAQLE
jgi:hypothetical protein